MAIPYAMLGGAQLAVGAAGIFARFALGGALPLAVCAARLTIASLALLAIAAFRRGAGKIVPNARERAVLGLAGLFLALHFAGWIWSLEYVSVAESTLLVTTTPIWTALYDSLFLKRHLSLVAWGAFAAGAVGLLLVVGFNRTAPPLAGHHLAGALLALAGAFAIGAYWLLVRTVRERLDTRAIVTNTYAYGAVALIAAAALARQPLPAAQNHVAWGGILAMALISQLLGHTAMNAALRWFSPSIISFVTVLEPVIAALLALAIFGESLTPLALLGGVIVIGAIAVVLREDHQAGASEL